MSVGGLEAHASANEWQGELKVGPMRCYCAEACKGVQVGAGAVRVGGGA